MLLYLLNASNICICVCGFLALTVPQLHVPHMLNRILKILQ